MNKEKLSEKMMNGAKALYDIFEYSRQSRELLTDEKTDELVKNYELTQNQKVFLNNTLQRTKRAQGIVRYLENRFGVDEQLNFKDSKGLHELLFIGKEVPEGLEAKSYNIAIGLTKEKWNHRNIVGTASLGFLTDQLASPLEKTIEKLDKNKKTNVADLVFMLPNLDYFEKTMYDDIKNLRANSKAFCMLFNNSLKEYIKENRDTVINHEIRHIIDHILTFEKRDFNETPAYLYSENSSYGLNLDLEYVAKRLNKNYQLSNKRYKMHKKSKDYSKKENDSLKRYVNYTLSEINDFNKSRNRIKSVVEVIPTQDYAHLSYVFSTIPGPREQSSLKYIDLIETHYKLNKEKRK